MKSTPPVWTAFGTWFASLCATLGGVTCVGGAIVRLSGVEWGLAAAVLGVGLGLLGVGVGIHVLSVLNSTVAGNTSAPDAGEERANEKLDGLRAVMMQQIEQLRELVDAMQLSDTAKRVAFRNKERDALRSAIQEEVDQEDWEAADFLVDEMERRFGYRHEAEVLRREIAAAQRKSVDQGVDRAARKVEELCARREWGAARVECERLAKLFGDHPVIQGLPERVEIARAAYKADRIRAFQRAAERGETDPALEIIKELDRFLTPKEAEAYKDLARGVLKDRAERLSVSFSMAWNGKDWAMALQSADQILKEFPHSRLADEVRERMPQLQELAAGASS